MSRQPASLRLVFLAALVPAALAGWWWVGPVFSSRPAQPPAAPAAVKVQVYDPDPEHLWNRLHAALFVRPTMERGGKESILEGYNPEQHAQELDPLLWHHSKYLLSGPGGKPALALLDEFLDRDGEKRIKDPLRRALLQRDLWALFDWAASPSWLGHTEANQEKKDPLKVERQALATRLARIIQRLALSRDQIAALPDNYAAAVAAKTFPGKLEPPQVKTAYLPPDLWKPQGPWVLLGDQEGKPLTPGHVSFFGGRSTFRVLLRLPQGRDSTLEYLGELRGWSGAGGKGNPPQVPSWTEVALVRQMVLLDDRGEPVPTRLTEMVQLRVLRQTDYNVPYDERTAENRFEIKLRRQDLLAGKAGGLRAVKDGDTERDFLLFLGNNAGEGSSAVLGSCRHCHQGPGIKSVNTYTRFFDRRQAKPDLTAAAPGAEATAIVRWKRAQLSWGLLHWLWEERSGR